MQYHFGGLFVTLTTKINHVFIGNRYIYCNIFFIFFFWIACGSSYSNNFAISWVLKTQIYEFSFILLWKSFQPCYFISIFTLISHQLGTCIHSTYKFCWLNYILNHHNTTYKLLKILKMVDICIFIFFSIV